MSLRITYNKFTNGGRVRVRVKRGYGRMSCPDGYPDGCPDAREGKHGYDSKTRMRG